MKIESTSASCWAQRYKKKYWYGMGIGIIIIGLPLLVILPLGIGLIAIGGYIIYRNNKYWKEK